MGEAVPAESGGKGFWQGGTSVSSLISAAWESSGYAATYATLLHKQHVPITTASPHQTSTYRFAKNECHHKRL